MVTCRFCGFENQDDRIYCKMCGKELRPQSAADTPGQVEHLLFAERGRFAAKTLRVTVAGICIGRHPTLNQIVFEDPEVGRQHARVYLDSEGKVQLEDNGSVNGTYVNNRRVERATLQPGDRMRLALNPSNCLVYTITRLKAEPSPAYAPESLPEELHQYSQPPEPPPRPRGTLVELVGAGVGGPRLQLVLDRYAVEDILLEKPRMELGRTLGSKKIVIDHGSVSDVHAELIFAQQKFWQLRNLSANGTFINGERIEDWRMLEDGDLIRLGACETRLLLYREPYRRSVELHDHDLSKRVTTLGSDRTNSIHLDHPTVSRFHAEIHRTNGDFELIDKGSTNGTYVNGLRIQRHRLRKGDRLALGGIQIVFDGSQLERSAGGGARLWASGLRRCVRDPQTGCSLPLLNNISLAIEPREFVGVLGPSGAGKTILMHALNGFYPADEGCVQFNGWNLYEDFHALRTLIGYLPQDDILHRELTVRDCLYYAARLRLPKDYTEKNIWDRVVEVLKILQLEKQAELLILRLSGGQRKRVSLGIELLSKPSLLFMDEPTAGQDPRTEMNLMQLFREVANRGSTVIITTHLLGSFSLLDKVTVVVQGRLVYFGPGPNMSSYFETARPHDVYERLQEKPPEEWEKKFRESEYYRDFIANPLGEEGPARPKKRFPPPSPRQQGWRQLGILVSRQLALKLTDRMNMAWLLLSPVVIAFLLGFIQHNPNRPDLLLMIVFAALWFGCSASVREIVDEEAIYRRERQRSLSMASYLGSKLIYVGALAAIQSGCFVAVLTWVGAQANHFFAAWGMMWLMMLQGALIGLLISSLSSTPEKALSVFPLALIPQLLLAGVLIPVRDLDVFKVQNEDGKYFVISHENVQGMPAWLGNGISPLMVSRWGLEALADLYIHDFYSALSAEQFKKYPYPIPLLCSISITFHPAENKEVRADLELLSRWSRESRKENPLSTPPALPSKPPALLSYFMILAAFAVGMLIAITASLKRKERRQPR